MSIWNWLKILRFKESSWWQLIRNSTLVKLVISLPTVLTQMLWFSRFIDSGHWIFNVPGYRENTYNLAQKAWDKFTKLGKIGIFMKCFTADYLQFFTKKRQNLAFGWTAGYLPSNPSISGIFLRQHVHSLSGDNNLVPFHLWWRQIVLKSAKVYKCFVQDCRSINFFYKQPALGWQTAKQPSGVNPRSLSNRKNYRLWKSRVFPL